MNGPIGSNDPLFFPDDTSVLIARIVDEVNTGHKSCKYLKKFLMPENINQILKTI
jgi:hypothetical protein